MKKFLKWLAMILGVVVIAAGVFLFAMRFHDGPLEIISGGPFKTGESAPAPADWSFLRDRSTLQFQTMDPARSRTVWLAVVDGRLFVISGYMTTGYGKIWKQWPHYLDNDDRVILRIDGKLYQQRLRRVMDGPEVIPVMNEFGRKYGTGEATDDSAVSSGYVWMFEVVDY